MLTRVLSRRRGQVLAHPPVSLFKLDRQSLYFRGAMRTKQVVGPLLGLLSFFPPFAAAQDSAKSAKLTIEQLIDIKHPSNPVWSPDGKHVTFSWDRAGVTTRYVSDLDGREPRPVTEAPPAAANMNGTPSPDGSRVAFVRSTSMVRSGSTSTVGSGFRRTDGRGGRGATASGPSELWVRTVADGQETRVAAMDTGFGGVSWSPDGAYLLFTSGGGAIRHEQTPPYSGAKIIYATTENQPGQAYSVAVAVSGAKPISLPQ